MLQDHLDRRCRDEHAGQQLLAVDLTGSREVEMVLEDAQTGAIVAGVLIVAKVLDLVGPAVTAGILQRDEALELRRRLSGDRPAELDVHDAVARHRHVPRPADAVVENRRLEPLGQCEVATGQRRGWLRRGAATDSGRQQDKAAE